MKRFNPIYGILLVLAFTAAVLGADFVMSGSARDFIRVGPEKDGTVRIEIADLGPNQVRFYRFLNAGNQEVKFLVGRDEQRQLVVAFDAAESDYKRKRGFRHEGEWLVNNKCDTATRLSEAREGRGGCAPVLLAHSEAGGSLILTESDILAGWRYFR